MNHIILIAENDVHAEYVPGWYFADETGELQGPYSDEETAIEYYEAYAKSLDPDPPCPTYKVELTRKEILAIIVVSAHVGGDSESRYVLDDLGRKLLPIVWDKHAIHYWEQALKELNSHVEDNYRLFLQPGPNPNSTKTL